MANVTVDKIISAIARPYGAGTLTNTYIQRGYILNASVKSNFAAVNTRAVNLIGYDYPQGGAGKLVDIEFRMAAEFQANATTLMEYQWQARNLKPTPSAWASLCANTAVSVTTAWSVAVMAGRYTVTGDTFNSIPFELRMAFKTNHQNVGIARVLSNSYIHYTFKID